MPSMFDVLNDFFWFWLRRGVPGSSFFFICVRWDERWLRMSAPFFYGEIGEGGGKMGWWIFLSWNCIFDWKYISKSVNFTFSLPFLKVKTVVNCALLGNMTALPVNNWKTISVSSLYSARWTYSSLCPSRLALENRKDHQIYLAILPGWNLTMHKELRLFPFGGTTYACYWRK